MRNDDLFLPTLCCFEYVGLGYFYEVGVWQVLVGLALIDCSVSSKCFTNNNV